MDPNEARLILASGWPGRHFRDLNFDGLSLISAVFGAQRFWTGCSFVGADLRQATFDGNSFFRCDFRDANLQGASMRGVSLNGCNLRGANLMDVDLRGAQLGYINTGRDDVGRTDLTGADLSNAVLVDVDMQRVIGWPSD